MNVDTATEEAGGVVTEVAVGHGECTERENAAANAIGATGRVVVECAAEERGRAAQVVEAAGGIAGIAG
jgi:hypothetical protein